MSSSVRGGAFAGGGDLALMTGPVPGPSTQLSFCGERGGGRRGGRQSVSKPPVLLLLRSGTRLPLAAPAACDASRRGRLRPGAGLSVRDQVRGRAESGGAATDPPPPGAGSRSHLQRLDLVVVDGELENAGADTGADALAHAGGVVDLRRSGRPTDPAAPPSCGPHSCLCWAQGSRRRGSWR
jgi:hypothetical protein